MSTESFDNLLTAVNSLEHLLILPHNDPDPDAVASAVGLSYLLEKTVSLNTTLAYRGLIGRAENKALVEYLDRPLAPLSSLAPDQKTSVSLVDTQPGAGNNSIPEGAKIYVVIDHHPLQAATSQAVFADVRVAIGSTSTIVTQYFQAAELEPDKTVATALFYGLKTDTMGLTRGASPADLAAYIYLQPKIDTDALIEIERAQVPLGYFKSFDAALRAARIYDNRIVISYIGTMAYPDLAAEMADVFLRLQGSEWVVCLGEYQGKLILSVRTRNQAGGAGLLAIVNKQGVAGGHGTMAGGHLPLLDRNPKVFAHQLSQQVLRHLNLPPHTKGSHLV